MIGIRLAPGNMPPETDATEIWISDYEFEAWVRSGRVGPDTVVWAGPLSKGEWRRADELEIFHLFRAEPEAPAPPGFSLRDRLLPVKGFSAVETLVMANVLVAAVLLGLWRDRYSYQLVVLMRDWHRHVAHFWDLVITLPTLFIHASAGHLLNNLLALVVAAGAVEVFFGGRRTWIAYLVTGFMGSVFSYYGHSRPPLSVGASGAVYGLGGVMTAFLFRFYPRFSDRQKWKTRRIYAPLFLFLIPPGLFQADVYAHGGGFLMGILLGLWLPLSAEGEKLIQPEAEPGTGRILPLRPSRDSEPPDPLPSLRGPGDETRE